MTLLSEVNRRLSEELRADLTNQDTRGTGLSPVTDKINAAIEDMKEEFLDETGIDFDENNQRHIRVGVFGTLYYLHIWTNKNTEAIERFERRWNKFLIQVARSQGAERRVLPRTTVTSQPSTPQAGRLPEEDPVRWNDYVLDPPKGSETDSFRIGD